MLRLALTPRWIVGLLALLVLIVAAVLLGRWQWDRTQTILAAERAAASQPVPVEEVFADDPSADVLRDEVIGRPVTARGTYDPSLQVVVVNRSLQGNPGVWIVTGLRLDDGRVLPVLRGWVASADEVATQVPSGPVTVTGVLQPDEEFYAAAETPVGSVPAISRERLAQQWSTDLLPGFVVLQVQDPSLSAAPSPVPPTVQTADVAFPLQNFFYAFQWWIFAAFGLIIYLRWLWIESGREDADSPALH